MLKIKNQDVMYKIISFLFSLLCIILVIMSKKTLDFIYLGVICLFIFKFMIVKYKK